MEERGHIFTGMNNRIVWGMPHVFAIFLIVAASGVLNVASIGSVFGHAAYKARAPFSGLLCLALLAGGLTVLMLDLGRPERIVVAATHYNFTSVFAWNMFLYTGMAAIVAVYLWVLMERRFNRWSRPVGIAAFAWRIILTSGTGSIFAFLVARQAYGTALLVPLFLAMSFAWGLAIFLVAQSALAASIGRPTPIPVRRRMSHLLALFIATVLLLVAAYHLTNLYFAKQAAFERFLLVDGGIYPHLLVGLAVAGSVFPRAALASALPPPAIRRRSAADNRRASAPPGVHHRRAGLPVGDVSRLCGN
jgi:molybdopterin-containing oxidoreductase family membrane subunit